MPESKDHFQGRHYDAKHSTGPVSALNPTTRYHPVANAPTNDTASSPGKPSGAVYVWRSRDNRKGRHAMVLDPEHHEQGRVVGATPTDSWRQALSGVSKMALDYPIWDVSYDVAVVFTIGKSARS